MHHFLAHFCPDLMMPRCCHKDSYFGQTLCHNINFSGKSDISVEAGYMDITTDFFLLISVLVRARF